MRLGTGHGVRTRLAAVASHVRRTGSVLAGDDELAGALRAAGLDAGVAARDGGHDLAVVLLADDPEGWEALVASLASALRPGGRLVVGTTRTLRTGLPAAPGGTVDADGLRRLLGHRGFACELVCAPGAADLLSGARACAYRPELDRRPGLLEAGDLLVAVGALQADGAARSAEFFATLPRKVVAAAVVCRDGEGRLLVVHDSFKRHWTIPGGVVDPDEDPRSAAARECWEEAGVRVGVGPLLGVFAGRWPDRLVFVYAAEPRSPGAAQPEAVHAHEIDAVAWAPLAEALERLAPHVRSQVVRCLEHPGQTWPPDERA